MSGIASELLTLRDFLRYAVSRFNEARLGYGHGTTTAFDEAAFLLLEGLHLPIDQLEPFLDARLTALERERLAALVAARVETRKPAPYLVKRAYIKGIGFHVDERVIVPRSLLGELLLGDMLLGDGGLIPDPEAVATALDLCTGSGCLAIIAAQVFPEAAIDATDISEDALAVARENVAENGFGERIALRSGDLFAPLEKERYDLIITNPPYVAAAAMAALPPEWRHEPALALAGGEDGLDVVRRILAEAPKHLTESGLLLCEFGSGRDILASEFPALPFRWLDTEETDGAVFCLKAGDFPTA